MTWLARLRKPRRHNGPPTPPERFRLMRLDDNTYPTYTGWRTWCTGSSYWWDNTCECTHQERPRH